MVTTYADGKTAYTVRNERDQVYFTHRRNGDMQQIWYDSLGRSDRTWEMTLADPVWPHGRQTKTSFDLAGRPMWTAVSTQTGATYDPALERDVRTYQYDAAGRVELDRIQPNSGAMGSNQLVLTYGYDKTNNRTSIQWPDGYRADYRFDAANRADRVTFGPAASPTQNSADIAVDSLSRRTGLSRSNGANSTYAYEADSDLSSLNHAWASGVATLPASFGYQHDAQGRITLTTVNQVSLEWMPTLAEAASYGTPSNLNQTTSANGTALIWDDNGNLDQYGSTDYQWTCGNRLWRVVKPTSTTEYAYDSIDRRTSVIEDGVMTRTLWSGQDEVGQYTTAGAVLRRFIPDGSGAMDARMAAVDAAGAVVWFHSDHQGSVIATTNGAGQPIQFANYSPHGKFGTDQNGIPYTAPPSGSPFGYTGRQWDAKAGLYNYRARYYDPSLGVFLSMDPIGTKDDPNLYMYVGLDPVNATDPSGLCSVNADRALVDCDLDFDNTVSTADQATWQEAITEMGLAIQEHGSDQLKESWANTKRFAFGVDRAVDPASGDVVYGLAEYSSGPARTGRDDYSGRNGNVTISTNMHNVGIGISSAMNMDEVYKTIFHEVGHGTRDSMRGTVLYKNVGIQETMAERHGMSAAYSSGLVDSRSPARFYVSSSDIMMVPSWLLPGMAPQ